MSNAAQPAAPQESGAKPAPRRKPRQTYMLHDPKTMACKGKFTSTDPRYAALKASSRGFTDIWLRKTNTKMIHVYEGGQKTLDTPQKVKRGDSVITYTKKPFVKSKRKFVYTGNQALCDDADTVPENPKA